MNIIITGGSGFIGSCLVKEFLKNSSINILNIDKLTYAANQDSLIDVAGNSRYSFKKVDILDSDSLEKIFKDFKPNAIMHLAAESHVDRSIFSPREFINTNIIGTFNLLEESRRYYNSLDKFSKANFIFHHISTDEVYGDLEGPSDLFTEETHYAPSSPYSASKASSDHMVRAWNRTYGLPVIITNCSNNYGPYQFPEKLIPLTILNALMGKTLPVYGNGLQVRDWLFVEDHAKALINVLMEGEIGETYNIGGHNEKTNIEVVESICKLLDELTPIKPVGLKNYHDLISFVKDRPGHDERYAIDASKIRNKLGWIPEESFESGLLKTVVWYIDNKVWWERVLSGDYQLQRKEDEK